MQVTIDVPVEVLTPLIEATVRAVLSEKPSGIEADAEPAAEAEPEPPAEAEPEPAAESGGQEAASEEKPEPETAPATAALPDDFNILLHAKAWVADGENAAARRKWLKDELDRIEVKSLTALSGEQLPVFVEAMKNAAV